MIKSSGLPIGFVGLGHQGSQLARRLVARGFRLIVHDLRPEAAAALRGDRVEVAESLVEVAEASRVICVCVVDDAQVEGVTLGDKRLLVNAGRGSTIIIHSTVSPATIARIAEAASEREIHVIDAPVSGGSGPLEIPMLYMVGGPEDAVRACLPLFGEPGVNVVLTGATGTGVRAKLAHQLIACINMVAANEGSKLAHAYGLRSDVLEGVVSSGAAQSRLADNWSRISIGSAAAALLRKDLDLCLEFGRECGLSLEGAETARRFVDQIVVKGG